MIEESFLLKRIMEPRPPIQEIIDISYPVTSFGDINKARVLTVGINPSSREYFQTGAKAQPLPLGKKRLVDSETLDIGPGSEINLAEAKEVLDGNNNYFAKSGNPYHWFNLIEQYALAPIGASYFDGSAAHVDIVQWATDPIWSEIQSVDSREKLIQADAFFLNQIFAMGEWDLVIVNGRQVYQTMREARLFKLFELEQPVVAGKKRMFWNGKAQNSPLVAWSVNIQQSRTGTETREYCSGWINNQLRRIQSDEFQNWFKSN